MDNGLRQRAAPNKDKRWGGQEADAVQRSMSCECMLTLLIALRGHKASIRPAAPLPMSH
jgi:hypothetical protein